MARKIKKGLNYFPHDCEFDDELNYIISKHKSEGYHVFFSLLEKIYFNEGYFMNASEKNIFLLSSKINVNINSINDIINDCLCEHLFDKSYHHDYKILTSKGIQARYFEAIKRRKEVEIINDYILIDYVDILGDNVNINSLNVDISTQSKVKKSRVKKSKEEKSIIEPTLKERVGNFVEYCNNNIKQNGNIRSWKVTEKVSRQFSARLREGFTSEQIVKSIKKAKQVQAHKDNNYQYLTPEFFTRTETLDKYGC